MEKEAIIHCSECRQLIVPGEDFVRFKVPGKNIYQCFHRRFGAEDCWGRRLKQRIEVLIGFMGSKACEIAQEPPPLSQV